MTALQKAGISLGASALVVIALIVIAGFGIYLNGTFNTASSAVETSSSIITPTTSVQTKAASSSNNGLVFTVIENSSSLQAGQVLGVSFDLFNTLDNTNNVSGAENWQLTDLSEQNSWNCAQNDVFRIEVISGYYGFNNYSSGTPLDVFPFQPAYAGLNQCLLYIHAAGGEPISDQNYGQNYYIFNPKSDVAQWVTTGIYTTCSSDSCTRTANGTIVGECNPCNKINQTAVMNETMILKPSLFANSAGVFTIVGGNEWGQLLILHFRVVAPFTPSLNGACLDEIPANTTIDNYQNSSFIGYKVTIPDGTTSYFPLGGCPSPVLPKLFTVAAEIEQNSSFIAAEGNYTYVVDPIGSLNAGGATFISGQPASSFTVVDFGYYTNQRIYPCGGTFLTLLELGRIQVDLPINPDGSYNYSDITIISSFSTSGVQMFSCTTQVTSVPTQSQTTISNETCTAAATLNQTTTTETVTLCHIESAWATNSTSSG